MGNTHFSGPVYSRNGFNTGTSSSVATTATANTKFNAIYASSTATSGDARGLYDKLYISGAGGSGEALRAYTVVNNVAAATAHGAHLSLSLGTTGSITGLGVASRATLEIPNAVSGGTFAAGQFEIWGNTATSSVSGATEASFARFVVSGDTADIKATVDTSGYLFSIQGLTVGSGKLFQVNTAAAASHALRILIGSTPYYVMLTSTGA